jgi:LysM repeat protein
MKKGIVVLSVVWLGSLLVPGSTQVFAQDSDNSHYSFQPGDSLLDVSLFYQVSTDDLVELNGLQSPILAAAGASLVVPLPANQPAVANEAPTEASTAPRTTEENPTRIVTQAENLGVYLIQPGDTLFRIATRFGVPLRALAYVNGIITPDTIYVGQQLKIPDGSEQVPDEPAPQAPAPLPSDPLTGTGGAYADWLTGKQIVVDLSDQMTFAYENGNLLGQFVVSTGLPGTPTVLGDYAIYIKLESQRMVGPDYDLPGVPWIMYFYQGYGLHGTYWHNNFGHPMSHGCVNMRTGDAEWMYSWAPIGTPVHVIP